MNESHKVSRGGRPQKQKRAVTKVLAEAILATINETQAWQELLAATTTIGGDEPITVPDNKIRLAALIYLTNRRDGCPAQSVALTDEREGVVLHGPGKDIPCPTGVIQ